MKRRLIDITDFDKRFLDEKINGFLPRKIIDIHTHVWRKSDFPIPKSQGDGRSVTWPARVAAENPIEDLEATYSLMLPDRQVTPLIFGTVPRGSNLAAQNVYISECAEKTKVPSLIFSDPSWSAVEIEEKIKAGGFLGAKSYLSLAPACLPGPEIRIFDFFPRHQLEVHDRNGWIVMLHIPRDARLRDPVNLEQILQIERDFPNLKLIVAHVGRAYCDEDVGDAFDVLAQTRNLCFDFCANTNSRVFEQALRCVGPQRMLFGTDLPILRMRMRRVCCNGRYINIVPRGLYGDVSGDSHMAEIDGEEAERITFFLYEELDAFRRAAERVQLSSRDIEDVFYNNAFRILTSAGWETPG